MSMWRTAAAGGRRRREVISQVTGPLIPSRLSALGPGLVESTPESAKRHSAVWACRRLRADLLSTMPVDVYRDVNGVRTESTKPPIFVEPDGLDWPWVHWAWASQWELDGEGNQVGLIVERNMAGLPSRIELVPASEVSITRLAREDTWTYRVGGRKVPREQIWHERQFPVPGLPVGMSPLMYAAWSISEGLSMQQFALQWFGGGAVPKMRLRNTRRSLEADAKGNNEARRIKDRLEATLANGETFVHGNDWELDFMSAQAMGREWLDGRQATVPDVCRYLGCPSDLVEAIVDSGSSVITYGNISQRNLQLLIMHLGPAIYRREQVWSRQLLPAPRYVKLNTNALLRLDPQTRATVIDTQLKNRTLTNTEARALDDRAPLTEADKAEIAAIYGGPRQSPGPAAQPGATSLGLYDPYAVERVSPLSVIPYAERQLTEER